MVTVEERETVAVLPLNPIISWGAVFAGVAALIATSLLLTLFGAAIGYSIADVTELDAIGEGLGTGAVIWVILSTLVAFFVGGMLAGHLSGRLMSSAGLMHGVTTWAVGFLLMVMIDAIAVSSMVSAAAGATQSVASVTSSLGSKALQGVKMAAGDVAGLATSPYLDDVRARLKREAARVVSESAAAGGADVRQAEVRRAIDNMDDELLGSVASQIVAGDMAGAEQTLASGLDMSRAEVRSIIEGAGERIATAAEESELVQEIQGWLSEQMDTMLAEVSEVSGPEVDREELRRALDQLNADVTLEAAQALLTGDTQAAKNTIIANTNLSEAEVDAIVDGVSQRLEEEGGQLMDDIQSTVEKISDYVQALLWVYFLTYALSLGAAALGGSIGAGQNRSRATTATTRRRTTVE